MHVLATALLPYSADNATEIAFLATKDVLGM